LAKIQNRHKKRTLKFTISGIDIRTHVRIMKAEPPAKGCAGREIPPNELQRADEEEPAVVSGTHDRGTAGTHALVRKENTVRIPPRCLTASGRFLYNDDNGTTKVPWDLKAGQYLMAEGGIATFTTHSGKPSLGFKQREVNMKKTIVFAMAIVILFCTVACAEDAVHTFWDIPYGIDLKDAAAMATEKTGAILEPFESPEGELWFFSTPEGYPLNIAGHPFKLRVSSIFGFVDATENDSSFQQLSFGRELKGTDDEIRQSMRDIQQTISDIYKMLCAKCGEPDTVSFMYAKAGRPNGYVFDVPLTSDGVPDIQGIYETGERDSKFELYWNNVNLSVDVTIDNDEESYMYSKYGEPYITIYISLIANAKSLKPNVTIEYKGDYFEYLESLRIGVTSF